VNCLLLKGKKNKGRYSSSREPHLRAMGRHLPYGITQCYLRPDTRDQQHNTWQTKYCCARSSQLWKSDKK